MNVRPFIAAVAGVAIGLLGTVTACTDDSCTGQRECEDKFGEGWTCEFSVGVCVKRTPHAGAPDAGHDVGDTDAGDAGDAGVGSDGGGLEDAGVDGGASDAGMSCGDGCPTGTRCVSGACVCDATSCADGCCNQNVCTARSDCGTCGTCAWTTSAPIPTGEEIGAVMRLTDGRVFGAVGRFKTTIKGSTWVYNPTSDSMTVLPVMSQPRRRGYFMEAISGGGALVCGGWETQPPGPGDCERFSFVTNAWTPAATLPSWTAARSGVAFAGGTKVLVIGATPASQAATHVYDIGSDAWTPAAPISTLLSPFLVELDDGRILAVGGAETASTVVEMFDPASATWSIGPSLNAPTDSASGIKLTSGRVLVFTDTTLELFDPVAGTWTLANKLPVARQSFGLVALSNGRAMAAGGTLNGAETTAVDIFDANTLSWTSGVPLPIPLRDPSLLPLSDGSVFLLGGRDHTNTTLTSTFRFR